MSEGENTQEVSRTPLDAALDEYTDSFEQEFGDLYETVESPQQALVAAMRYLATRAYLYGGKGFASKDPFDIEDYQKELSNLNVANLALVKGDLTAVKHLMTKEAEGIDDLGDTPSKFKTGLENVVKALPDKI